MYDIIMIASRSGNFHINYCIKNKFNMPHEKTVYSTMTHKYEQITLASPSQRCDPDAHRMQRLPLHMMASRYLLPIKTPKNYPQTIIDQSD